MTSCDEARQLAPLYAEDPALLESAELMAFEAHLAGCEACAQEVEELRALLGELHGIEELELPMGFHQALSEKLRIEELRIEKLRIQALKDIASAEKSRRKLFPSLPIIFVSLPSKTMKFGFKPFVAAAAGILLTLVVISGAGSGIAYMADRSAGEVPQAARLLKAGGADSGTADAAPEIAYNMTANVELPAESASFAMKTSGMPMPDASSGGRMSHRSATIELQVEDFDAAMAAISGLSGNNTNAVVNDYGYSKRADVTRRVDNIAFESDLAVLRSLGEVSNETAYEQALDAQIYDTEARVRALESERARLMKLLDESKSMSVMLMVDQRLAEVDNDLDWMKGTLRSLKSDAASGTITISLHHYEEPTEPEKPENYFFVRLQTAFIHSLNGTIRFMENTVVFLSGAILPLTMLAVILVIAVAFVRGRRRKHDKE